MIIVNLIAKFVAMNFYLKKRWLSKICCLNDFGHPSLKSEAALKLSFSRRFQCGCFLNLWTNYFYWYLLSHFSHFSSNFGCFPLVLSLQSQSVART